MRSTNTFGIHFVLRMSRGKNGKAAIYVHVVVNKSRSEIALKRMIDTTDWNKVKGMAKPKNVELKALNSYCKGLADFSPSTTRSSLSETACNG